MLKTRDVFHRNIIQSQETGLMSESIDNPRFIHITQTKSHPLITGDKISDLKVGVRYYNESQQRTPKTDFDVKNTKEGATLLKKISQEIRRTDYKNMMKLTLMFLPIHNVRFIISNITFQIPQIYFHMKYVGSRMS